MRSTAVLLAALAIGPAWADADVDSLRREASGQSTARSTGAVQAAPQASHLIAAPRASMPAGTAYAGPSVIDQRDAGYQMAIEHAANAQRALQRALDELERSRSYFSFPGFEYPAIARDMSLARDALDAMLVPEKRRLRYQTLIPDGTYMRVPSSQSSPPQ